MVDSVAGVVLAAGAGTRLAPLTRARPKVLCPVGRRPLLDWGLDRLRAVLGDDAGPDRLAVNAHRSQAPLIEHARAAATVSVESPEALGTAGALGRLRSWIDGRHVLVTNGDGWLDGLDLAGFVAGWDGERTRLLTVPAGDRRPDFGTSRYCGVALLPWVEVAGLRPEPSGLWEVSWRERWAEGAVELVEHDGRFVDCGTPADYLAANLAVSGGESVVAGSARIGRGARLERAVVWDDAEVRPGERLVDGIRTDTGLTVLVR